MHDQIARRRKFFEYRVKIMQSAIPPLRGWAEIEKSNLSHPVHGKLKKALQTLAEREADLSRFYSENPPTPPGESQARLEHAPHDRRERRWYGFQSFRPKPVDTIVGCF
jgi:hypothetical protein